MKSIYTSIILVTFAFWNSELYASESESQPKIEICDNRIDDDGDGLIDCLDPDCSGSEACWECLTEFYQIHSNKYLVSLDPYTGTYTTLGTISGATKINGAQFNTIDGHVYAPSEINGVNKLGILKQDGTVVDTGLELPGSNFFYVGAIDDQGTMYISGASGIHSIDLTESELKIESLGISNPGVADFALDITNGLFYGISSSAKLKVFNPFQNKVDSYDLAGTINNDSGAFGACWSSNDGSFFAYNNSSGKIYTIDPLALTATQVLNGTGNLSINDGFNCVLAPPPFESNCGNGIDDDNDGLADCEDQDCYSSNKCTMEICFNGIDDDNDGWIDCSDSECFELELCVEICDNGIDDNNNGLIDGNDPQCNSPSGVFGGLESNRRLSDKIAKRNFSLQVNKSRLINEKKEGLIPFDQSKSRNPKGIESLIPTDVFDAFIAESSPLDIIDITNATEVVAADYYLEDRRIATVLGLYSENGVYEHSKYICDRLDGSQLLDVSYIFVQGGNFISYELLNSSGQKEFAVSFAATYDQSKGFNIESHWNLHRYQADSDYYNFQVWANSYQELIVLLESILEKMTSKGGIKSFSHSAIPRVFVMEGNYYNGNLWLKIRNKNFAKRATFKGSFRRREGGDLENITVELPLTGASEELINIETGFIYDLGASLSSLGSPDDEIFVADGSWGVEENSLEIGNISFTIKDENKREEEDIYVVERSIQVSANVKDYLNVYRTLDAKFNAKDLSSFNSLNFAADGKGILEITLVKKSIDNWQDQYRKKLILDEDNYESTIMFNEFESTLKEPFDASDLTMLVFTLVGNNVDTEERNLKLSNVRFSNSENSPSNESSLIRNSVFSPNPVKNTSTFSFETDVSGQYELHIMDIFGRNIFSKKVKSDRGINSINVDLSRMSQGSYFYTLMSKSRIQAKGVLIKP